jgi:hypothetical protein
MIIVILQIFQDYINRNSFFVVPLVKGRQEQQQTIEDMKKMMDELKKQNELLKRE